MTERWEDWSITTMESEGTRWSPWPYFPIRSASLSSFPATLFTISFRLLFEQSGFEFHRTEPWVLHITPQTTPMKHLSKIKRKKSPEPSQQTISGAPVDITAGPPAFQTELDGILDGRQSSLSGSNSKLT